METKCAEFTIPVEQVVFKLYELYPEESSEDSANRLLSPEFEEVLYSLIIREALIDSQQGTMIYSEMLDKRYVDGGVVVTLNFYLK